MAAAVDDQTKLIIVCNPNNPTGTYNTAAEFAAFLAAVPERVIVAVDEAYYEYVTADDYPQTLPLRAAASEPGRCCAPSARSTRWPGCAWATAWAIPI